MSITLDTPAPWKARSACQGLDPDIFYPDPDDDNAAGPAKAICAGCPVKEHCLEHAIAYRETGVWGGTTERERRNRRRRRHAA